jgi:DNA-binding transcriptional MerR regulator
MEQQHTLTGSAVGRRFGITGHAVLYYVRRGIARPIRDSSGRRLYCEEDVKAIKTYRMRSGRA